MNVKLSILNYNINLNLNLKQEVNGSAVSNQTSTCFFLFAGITSKVYLVICLGHLLNKYPRRNT